MRYLLFCSIFILCSGFAAQAQAESKPWIWSWGPSHWRNLDFEKPYIEPAKEPHNTQWDNRGWYPSHWGYQRGGNDKMVDKLYRAGVFKDQYIKDGVPVLAVGEMFYRLGGEDKRRVVAMVDEVYRVTDSKENGLFLLYDGRTERPIGLYTKHGLQLQ
ncbi:MAG: hypothetical protein H6868_10260 [Rhodospirillales bacterium]|nr:hypothetical protein [Rhodospirillales bacterium]